MLVDRWGKAQIKNQEHLTAKQSAQFIPDLQPSKYRADIDGLRAVAVLVVLIFHTGISPLRGGFIGVDIFFVISGYLITRLIKDEFARGTFSIARFYERRARRIFPALAVMSAIVLLACPFLLFPAEMDISVKTALAAVSSFSNLYLLTSAGYFAADAATQPFIHTWSLGVEEQFYLLFPLVLWLFRRFSLSIVFAIIVALGLASFGGGILLTAHNRDFAYYFPLTRGWELLAGAVLVYMQLPRVPRLVREAIALASLALIMVSAYKFHAGMNFPGYYAAVPCVAAAALIAAGGQGKTATGWLLASAPFVWVGRISYSLYLWHWPVFVAYFLVSGRTPSAIDAFILILISVFLAYLSWRFVEQPVRQRDLFAKPSRLWLSVLASYVVVIATGFFVLTGWGHASSPPTQADRLTAYLNYDDTLVYRRGTCFYVGYISHLGDYDRARCLTPSTAKANVLVMGDSHAAHLWYGLDKALPAANVMQATSSSCMPVIGSGGDRGCLDMMNMIFNDFLKDNKPDILIISALWEQRDMPDLISTLRELRGKAGRIVIFGPIVDYYRAVPRLLAQVADGRSPSLLVSGRQPEQRQLDIEMKKIVEAEGATYVSVYSMFCPVDGSACATVDANGVPLQWDYGHLTKEGSEFVAEKALATGALEIPGH